MTTPMMKAMCYEQYGTPEVIVERVLPTPDISDNEVLIKVAVTTVTSADGRLRRADPWLVRLFFGIFRPKNPILGSEFAGEIVQVGKAVRQFKVGDKVFGSKGEKMGAHAQYLAMDEEGAVVHLPENVSYEQAASVPFGASTALYFLQLAQLESHQKVLIYGASSAIGVMAIQLAKYYGADVTTVCSGKNIPLMKQLGADRTIDYQQEDFTEIKQSFDIVMDTQGKTSFGQCKPLLKEQGRYIPIVAGIGTFIKMLGNGWRKKKITAGVAIETKEQMLFLQQLLQKEKIHSVIDKEFNWEDIQYAHQYIDAGHKVGAIILKSPHSMA